MKLGKTIVSWLLVGAMALSIAACGSNGSDGTKDMENSVNSGDKQTESAENGEGEDTKPTASGTYMKGALFQFGIVPVNLKDGTAGYMDMNGEWYIDPVYNDANSFGPDGVAFVFKKGEGWRCIDLNGEYVTDTVYKDVGKFSSSGIATIVIDGADGEEKGYFHKGENGFEHVIIEGCDDLQAFSDEGYAVAGRFNKAYGLLNSDFEWVVEPKEGIFLSNTAITHGLCAIEDKNEKKAGYIDAEGSWVITIPEYNPNKWARYGFGDNGLTYYDGAFYDTSWNKVFEAGINVDVDFRDSVWARSGTKSFNYYNESGEKVLHMTNTDLRGFACTEPVMIADRMFCVSPVYLDENGKVTDIVWAEPGRTDCDRDEFEKVVINSKLEIVFVLADKGLYDISNYYADGYAYSEIEDNVFAIIDSEGNTICTTPKDATVTFVGHDIREFSNIQ